MTRQRECPVPEARDAEPIRAGSRGAGPIGGRRTESGERGIPTTLAACLVVACAAALAGGCAAPLRIDESVDALALVGPGALVYARMDADSARKLAPYLVPADGAKALKPLLDRTSCLALGLGAPGGAPADAAAGKTGAEAGLPGRFDAAFVGDFPFRTASLALASDRSWKREGKGFVNEEAGIRAAVPGPSLVLASTGPLEPLLEAAKSPGPSPIPGRLERLASRRIAIWAPEPFSGLVASVVGEPMDIPALGLLVAATPDPETGDYSAAIAFVMRDADSARVFRPALRLAWYGIARGLLGEGAEGALGLGFALDGELYWADGARIPQAALAEALSRVKEGYLLGRTRR